MKVKYRRSTDITMIKIMAKKKNKSRPRSPRGGSYLPWTGDVVGCPDRPSLKEPGRGLGVQGAALSCQPLRAWPQLHGGTLLVIPSRRGPRWGPGHLTPIRGSSEGLFQSWSPLGSAQAGQALSAAGASLWPTPATPRPPHTQPQQRPLGRPLHNSLCLGVSFPGHPTRDKWFICVFFLRRGGDARCAEDRRPLGRKR